MSHLLGIHIRSRVLLALTSLGLLAATLAAFWMLFHFVRPAPPRTVTMATGSPGGAYALFAERYRQALKKEEIELILRPSSGSVENLRLLKTDEAIDIGFVQSGIANEPDSEDIALLGSMYIEPVWLFHHKDRPITQLTQLAGMRVALGSAGSGTQLLALQLLSAAGIAVDSAGLTPLDGNKAAAALLDESIDAAFMVAAPEAPAVQTLLKAPQVTVANLTHAAAYARRFPHLATLSLPAGSIDLTKIDPAIDTQLLGATANLVARADLHPAIVALILQAGKDIHSAAGLFQNAGEYPALRGRDLPAHPAARRFFESGPPFLQRYLPFWLAVMVDRLLVSLLPLLAILIPLMRITPALYTWRMRARIYRLYGELKFLEQEIGKEATTEHLEMQLERLDAITDEANRKRVPLSFSNELYTLREHIELVRRSLLGHAAPSKSPANRDSAPPI